MDSNENEIEFSQPIVS